MSNTPRKIYALMLASTNFVISWFVVQPIFSLFVLKQGLNIVELGFLLSLTQFLPLIFRIPLSVVAERIGRVRTLLIGLFITASSQIMFAYANGWNSLFLITLYKSLATGSFNQVSISTVSDMAPVDKQGDAIGQHLTFIGLGMMVGPGLCSLLINRFSYKQLFLISAIFPILGILLLLLWAPQVKSQYLQSDNKLEVGVIDSLKMIFRNRNVILLSYCRLSFSTTQSIFLTLFSIYAVNSLNYSESTVAFLFMIRGLTNTLSRLPAGKISDKIGRKTPLMIGYLLLTISYILLAVRKDLLMLSIALILYGVSWGTRAVSEWTFLTDLVEPEIKTISISYLSSVFGLGSTIGSILAGILNLVLPYGGIFLICSALNFGALPIIKAMKKT